MSVAARSLTDLAGLVQDARVQRYRSIEAAAEAAGMSPMTWRRVEVDGEQVRRQSHSGVEQALGWPRGSIRTYMAGGPAPTPAESATTHPDSVAAPRLNEATWDELMDEIDRRYRALTRQDDQV